MRGVRAECAKILCIAVPSEARLEDAARSQLAERYHVPVVAADEVPHWVIDNVRDGGPPPPDRSLALDLGALELGN
jgi:hypothetical protein